MIHINAHILTALLRQRTVNLSPFNLVNANKAMIYTKFRIRNFKGIKDTTVSLEGVAGASVFAFVGLNESGKTTILEAIHSFSPDNATSELLSGAKDTGVPITERVPRHQLSSFTGDVSVTATVSLSNREKQSIASQVLEKYDVTLDLDSFGNELAFERQQIFKDGDFERSYFSLRTSIRIKGPSQRKWREPSLEERDQIKLVMYGYTPDISYFPTFVFDFPERIYLTDRGDDIDRFYKTVFQDILDQDGRGYTIEKDVIRRVRSEELVVPWINFLPLWGRRSDISKIQHVMDRASATVTKIVFGRWNKIFGEDIRGKEILITFDVAEGEKKDAKGAITKTNEHDIYVKFQIRDGTRRFDVNDRSLGFRWFFAFMMFTQFRVARNSTRPLLFLFDEPASNLHAAAQQKLIDCFPEIAKDEHALIYTTHSHYMIEPRWLEQTFIVTNRADAPPDSVLDAVSLDDESLDIQVATYRSFVHKHPNQTSYFQPILDRLEVVPSRFDIQKEAIVLEGKSDYFVLRYASKLLGRTDLPLMPGLGAGTFGALAAMHVGWNLNFLFVLDGDRQGKEEQARYVKEYGIPYARVANLSDFSPKVKLIEDVVDAVASDKIKTAIGGAKKPTKAEIKRFFQESLASDNIIDLGVGFRTVSTDLLNGMKARF